MNKAELKEIKEARREERCKKRIEERRLRLEYCILNGIEFDGDPNEEIDGYSSVSSIDPELGKHGFDTNKYD